MLRRSCSLAFAGTLAATALLAAPSAAFCGFYVSGADAKLFNNATQVVLMREGTRTVLSMQNNYEGPPESFAMVVPVPVILQKENVKTLPGQVFGKIDQLDSPRLVEYWEQDPCASEERNIPRPAPPARRAAAPAEGAAEKKSELGVTVEAQFTVGEYEVVILSAKDAAGLETWLKQEKYAIPAGAEPLFRPYVAAGSKFFVARVDATKVTFTERAGRKMATLSPLRFHYDSEAFTLPVRLGLVNSGGTQDLIVHVLAKRQRYDVANYPNVTIPTNLDVSENARESFGSFYASLFDRTIEKNPKAVVTEYSWDASTCDPCPGPALSFNDLATLGADVMPASDGAPPTPGGGKRFRMMPAGYVITRLHARYSKESLGEDLVFKAAPPITGGREVRKDDDLEHGAAAASVNNFQGRYAIRHPWGGPIACKSPIRNRWGGPPAGAHESSKPQAASDLAFVARDAKLPRFVRSPIPELGVEPEGAAVSPVRAAALSPAGSTAIGAANDGGTGAGPSAGAARTGCAGCTQGAHEPPGFTGFGALFAVAIALGRRLLYPARLSSKSRESCRKSS